MVSVRFSIKSSKWPYFAELEDKDARALAFTLDTAPIYLLLINIMLSFTNSQAAKKLGISAMSLGRYIKAGKIPAPKMLRVGDTTLHAWTEVEIEHVRKLLPKIANGRKTRYQKLKKEAQPKAAVPHKKRKPKKK
jgi:predicted DNA-binding transcriptional regulator AlpA